MIILEKAGLRGLNEMVASASAITIWKSKMWMDPLGSLLFLSKMVNPPKNMTTRSENSNHAKPPVPGYGILAANLLARTWNEATQLQNAPSLGAAKSAARKWARSLQFKA